MINSMIQLHSDRKNEIEKFKEFCEKNSVEVSEYLNMDKISQLWVTIDEKTRDWYSIELPIHLNEDGYGLGDADEEKYEDEDWTFGDLDTHYMNSYSQAHQEMLESAYAYVQIDIAEAAAEAAAEAEAAEAEAE